MVDILLIQPPIEDFYHTVKRTIPYGLALIAAAASKRGYTVSILDALATGKSRVIPIPEALSHVMPFYGRADQSPFALFHQFRHYGYSFEHLGNEAKASGAFLIGIASLFTAYSEIALSVAREVKKRLPGSTVVLGGHHPTALPEAVMEEPAVDFVLRGEGEASLPELADTLKKRGSPVTVPGIVFRNSDGSLTINQPALMEDPDRLPRPDFKLIQRKFYQRFGKDSISITAGRGCPLACSYCATGRDSWMGFRKRSVRSVIDEIRAAMQGREIGFIDFEDENLTMDRRWFLELLEGIRRLFGDVKPELRAMNGLFPPTLGRDVVRTMKTTGFKELNLSLGSVNRQQLKHFNRPDVSAAFDRALKFAQQDGLSAVGYIIVGAPNQDPVSSVDDLLFLARRRVLAGVSVFYPAPGSVDYKRCRRLGVLPETFSAMRATALPIDQRTARIDSVTLLRLSRILNFIKSIIANGQPLPSPRSIGEKLNPKLTRRQKGSQLLASFLRDGRIMGIEPDGTVYRHNVSKQLCQRFLWGLKEGPMKAK